MRRAALVLVSGLVAFGCVDDLPKQGDIERMRLLGLATHVGELGSDQSTPAPGDTLFLELFVVVPTGEIADDIRVTWIACATVPLATPIDACNEDTIVLLGMNGPPTATMRVPVTTPDGTPPEGLVVLGLACDGGDLPLPSGPLGPDLLSQLNCPSARDQEIFTTTIPIACGEPAEGEEAVGCQRNAPNTRPPPLAVTLDGQAWGPTEPMPIDTREAHPAKYRIEVSVPSSDVFEAYTFRPYQSTATETRNEEFLVTFGADAGSLEAPYRVLSSDRLQDDLEWAAPLEEMLPVNREVRLHVVARDDRGGMRLQTLVAVVR